MNLIRRTLAIDPATDARLRELAAERGQDEAAVLAEAVALLDPVVDIAGPDVAEDRGRSDEFKTTRQAVPLDEVKGSVVSRHDPMPPQHVQAYKDATDNLIFLKKEQVQITFYSWVLLAALYILSKEATPTERWVLAAGALLVGALSCAILISFYRSIAKFRARLDYIYTTYFPCCKERKALVLNANSRHSLATVAMTGILIFACLAASAFTFEVVLFHHTGWFIPET